MAEEKRPLQDEAAAREEWRGSEERPETPAAGSLPASEDQDERLGGGGEGGAPADPRTPMPPD